MSVAVPSRSAAPTTELRPNVLSMPEVLAQSVASMAPSAAMALNPLLVFATAAMATWLSFGVALVLMLVVAYCAAQFAARTNSAGSASGWVGQSLGSGLGHAAGWGLVLGYLFTAIACVLGFEIYGSQFLSGIGVPTGGGVHVVLYALGALAPCTVALLDIRISARAAMALEAVSVTVILVLCVAVFVHNGGVIDSAQLHLRGAKVGGTVVGMVLAIFAFVGFESAGSLGHEARDPARVVPRAILISCGVVGLFYLLVSYVQVAGLGTGFAKATAPLPQLAGVVGLGALGHFLAIGITASMFACSLGCLNAAARIVHRFGEVGYLPGAVARTTERTKAPAAAILLLTAPTLVVPLAYILAGSTSQVLTGEMGTLATYGFMLAYGLVCVGAPVFLRRRGEAAGAATVLGALGATAMGFLFYVNWLPQAIPNSVFPALAWPYSALPYVFLAWTALGAGWYWVVRLRNPAVAAGRFSVAPAITLDEPGTGIAAGTVG